jgi:hypothetical protein
MENEEIEEVENDEEVDMVVAAELLPGTKVHTVEQRKRKVSYIVAEENATGLQLLLDKVGAAALVRRYQEFYIARNGLLSKMDKEDDAKFEGEATLPERGSDEVIHFNLLNNLPKPGSRRSKWGDLKPFVEQAKALLHGNGEKDPNEERIRTVAERLKKAAEQAKNNLLA